MKRAWAWKVFTNNNYGYYYSKEKALVARTYWQSLGIEKVMIKQMKG